MTKDREILSEIGDLLDRADMLEQKEKENPAPKISYVEFMARRAGIPVDEMERRMGLRA